MECARCKKLKGKSENFRNHELTFKQYGYVKGSKVIYDLGFTAHNKGREVNSVSTGIKRYAALCGECVKEMRDAETN